MQPNQQIQLKPVLSEYVANDNDNKRVDPKKEVKLYNNVSNLEKRFREDYPYETKLSWEPRMVLGDSEILVPFSININTINKTKTLSFYIPNIDSIHGKKIGILIINKLQTFLDKEKEVLITIDSEDKSTSITNDEIEFSNQVYIYSEKDINSDFIQNSIPLGLNLSIIYPEISI